MKTTSRIRSFTYAILGSLLFIFNACKDDVEDGNAHKTGEIIGTVTDDLGNLLTGVKVSIPDITETISNEADGTYVLTNVPVKTQIVNYSKTGYQTASVTITANDFANNNQITVNASLEYAAAKIKGVITDAKSQGAPLAGVTVSLSENQKTTSAEDGSFLIENLPLDNYTVTFTKTDYATVVRNITRDKFIDGIVTIDLQMGAKELLPGKTIDDLRVADKWYYNEYRGGRNAENYPHWDWACNYMCALDFQGAWEEQNEGTTLQIRNQEDDRKNPANLDVFDSYVYGSKKITVENRIMTLQLRTHSADASAPAYFGVQVIDLSETDPVAVKIGENKTYGSGDYTSFDFNLSQYVGKEVIIAIGIYRKETGDYWKQLVLRRIAFATGKINGWDWLPGTEVPGLEGMKMTQEIVKSTMNHTKKSFSGISPISGNRDNYVDAYRAWRDVAHIASEWSFVPLHKDPEVFPSEGYLIKTRGGTAVNTKEPESYYYAKFGIASGNNRLTLKTRTFGSTYTYFKLTAISEDGEVTHVSPVSNTAQTAESAEDGCWKFKHDAGGKDAPDTYANFVYDLSPFNGKNMMLIFGVYKGESNGDENKLAFYSIDMN
ncbi:MAG: carboxypeptidase regulatory-like domain-containing protein [Bacteroidales bacterium]